MNSARRFPRRLLRIRQGPGVSPTGSIPWLRPGLDPIHGGPPLPSSAGPPVGFAPLATAFRCRFRLERRLGPALVRVRSLVLSRLPPRSGPWGSRTVRLGPATAPAAQIPQKGAGLRGMGQRPMAAKRKLPLHWKAAVPPQAGTPNPTFPLCRYSRQQAGDPAFRG